MENGSTNGSTQLTQEQVRRAEVDAAREPGERVRKRGHTQCGIVLERTADSVLVWWGTADRKKVTTWEKPGNLAAWTGKEKAEPMTAPLKEKAPETAVEIDLRDVPASTALVPAPARKVRAPGAVGGVKTTPTPTPKKPRPNGNGRGKNPGGKA